MTTTNAMPLSAGISVKNPSSAESAPAEPPRPTTRKWPCRSIGSAVMVARGSAVVGSRESRGTLWIASGLLLALGVMVLGFIQSLVFAFPVLTVIGLATMVFLGTSNILIQTLSPDEVRGRAISVYSMILIGMVPAGSLLLGSMGSLFGLGPAFIVSGALAAIVCAATFALAPALRRV